VEGGDNFGFDIANSGLNKLVEYPFRLLVPNFLDKILTAPLLLWRRVWYGCAFRRIKLENINKHAMVDIDDFYKLSKYRWWCRKPDRQHCVMSLILHNGIVHRLYMHREVMKEKVGLEHWNKNDKYIIDHINRNSLDNTRANLRFATPSQSNMNRGRYKNAGSKYKGIHYKKREGKWWARITVNGKRKYLGSFKNEIDAAKAYDAAAKKYYSRFACLNFPPRQKPKGLRAIIKNLFD
jgi:hypothetical protein